MRHALLIALAFAATSNFAFAADSDPPEPSTSWKYPPEMPGSRVEVYRTVGDVELKAWIFESVRKNLEPRPAIVFFFGGGWRAGTPGQFLPHCHYLSKRGMVAISVDYRVKNRNNTSPQDCLGDAKVAIRWVRENAERLGVDPNRIVASGGSAGGHLAAATGIVPGHDPDAGSPISSQPNAMVLFNPAVILAKTDGQQLLSEEKLKDISERCLGRPEEISPFHHLREKLPPSIIFHGTNDDAVPFPTVVAFRDRMAKLGNRCELVPFEGQPHGFFNAGRGKGKPREEANRYFHKTTRLMDEFLVSLGYLRPLQEH
ncbi:MAG: alpha/beta hydrolase [Planctomycetota bacterium]|jgi:acetyl esterase/lipase